MSALPLPLAHVLEEEYVRVHGGAEAPLERRWTLRDEELVDARGLARKLSAHFPGKPNIAAWEKASHHDPAYRRAVAQEVNEILGELAPRRWLYEHPAFADARKAPYDDLPSLDPAKRAPTLSDTALDADAVYNLNREMFDALFHDEVRRAATVRFAEIVARIHERGRTKPRTALSISGGGIRSATFALGVLQELARRKILEKFDFLSTVSGGGYIGSWLSSWVRRDPWGIRGVSALLSARPADALTPEPPPVEHLRAYSNYLTPKLGLLSADTWALVATYARNLLLNWVVLIPLLAGVLAIPRCVVTAIVRQPRGGYEIAGGGSQGAFWAMVTGVVLLTVALVVLISFRPIDPQKRRTFTDGKFIKYCLVPLLCSAIALTLAWAWQISAHKGFELRLDALIGIGILLCLGAFLSFLYQFLRTPYAVRREQSVLHRSLWELVGAVAAGATGGALIWVLTRHVFDDPVKAVQTVGVVRWPIADSGALDAVTASYVCFAVPLLLVVLFLQAVVYVGASSHQNHDFDREWWARASGWVLIAALAWIVLSAIAVYGPVAIYYVPKTLSALGGAAGLFSLLAGNSARTDAGSKKKGEESGGTKGLNFALALAVPIFVVYILALISLGTTWVIRKANPDLVVRVTSEQIDRETRAAERTTAEYNVNFGAARARIRDTPVADAARVRSIEHLRVVQEVGWKLMAVITLGCILIAFLVSRCIGVNVFSMHAMYRNRLVRAYLGASRWSRDPNAFTGFDPRDNMSMHELRPEYFWWYSFRDVEKVIAKLRSPATADARRVADAFREVLGSEADHVLNMTADDPVRKQSVYHGLNLVVAKSDLTGTPEMRAPEVLRPLRNRRFIERAFGEDLVFPSPNPKFCEQDVLVSKEALTKAFASGASTAANALREKYRHGDASLLDELNDIIADETLATLPPFDAPLDTTDFGLGDGVPVHRMIDNRLRLDRHFPGLFSPLQHSRPLHVINICLNLTTGDDLAWQERKGESFTVTPLASGNHRLGYRDSRRYGDISVGTAVTISGAAASPNMGYHSSPSLAFLMTLFNVRLGWWLGNPGLAGTKTWRRRNPAWSITPLLHEATGNSDDKYSYVYLSDGGHFENLGLYEMVLRRVHHIVVSDAGADPKYAYDDLGNAVRKIRIDLGISIDLTHVGILPPADGKPGKYCAIGTINYADVDGPSARQGELLYLKPVVYADEGPRDVLNYAKSSIDFPHESTADQFFSESQFESYRRLGAWAIEHICKDSKPPTSVEELIDTAKKYVTPAEVETKGRRLSLRHRKRVPFTAG